MRSLICASGLVVLVACSGQGDGDAGNNVASGPATNEQAAATPQIMPLRPGEWETTVEILRMELPGLPGTPPPLPAPMTTRHCITPELAAKPIDSIMSGGAMPAGCVAESNEVSGGRIRGAFTCNQNGVRMRMTMDGVFSPANYQINMQASGLDGQSGLQTDMLVRAHHVGECRTPPGEISRP